MTARLPPDRKARCACGTWFALRDEGRGRQLESCPNCRRLRKRLKSAAERERAAERKAIAEVFATLVMVVAR